MDNLFVQLIENAKRVSKNIVSKEEEENWEGLISVAAAPQIPPIDQLRSLIPFLYAMSNGKSEAYQLEARQLIADIITTFLILGTNPKDYEKDYKSLEDILKNVIKTEVRHPNLHCSQLISDVLAIKDYKDKKESWPKTMHLFGLTPFSEETGKAYVAFISNLRNLQKSDPTKKIDSRLEAKALVGNCKSPKEYGYFIKFITQQMATANAETKAIYELSLKTVASHLTLSGYINVVKRLLEDPGFVENMKAFLETTLPVLYEEKLKDTDTKSTKSRLKFIQFVNEIKDRYPSPLLDQYVGKIIADQVGKETWNKVLKDLAEIKSLEDKISLNRMKAEVPESLSKFAKELGEDFSNKFEKGREDLLRRAADSTGSFSGTIEAKLLGQTLTKQEDFSLLINDLKKDASIFKEELNKTYRIFKHDAEFLVDKVDSQFKKQIDAKKSEQAELNGEIKLLSEQKTKKTQEIQDKKERILELKSEEKSTSESIVRLNTLVPENFEKLKDEVGKFTKTELEKNSIDLKKNNAKLEKNRNALAAHQKKQDKFSNPSGINWFLRLFWREESIEAKKTALKTKETELKTKATTLEEEKNKLTDKNLYLSGINEKLDTISPAKLLEKDMKAILKTTDEFKVQFDKYTEGNFSNKIKNYENNLLEAKRTQAQSTQALNELSRLEGSIKELNTEIAESDKEQGELQTKLEDATKTLNDLEKAYRNCNKTLMQDFLTDWRTKNNVSPETEIDFSLSQSSDLREKLYNSISKGDLEGISQLLQNAKNWDIPNAQGNTPLQLALLSHQTDTAKFLIEKGAAVNLHPQGNPKQNTPLFLGYRDYANADTEEKKINLGDLVETLEGKGARLVPGEMDEEKNTILHLAAQSGDMKRAANYLEQAAKLNLNAASLVQPVNQPNGRGETALDLARQYDQGDMVGYLVQYHQAQGGEAVKVKEIAVDPLPKWLNTIKKRNFTNEVERKKWMETIKSSTPDQAKALVNAQDKNGDTLLHLAIKNKELENVGFLVNHSPDIMIANKKDETPLWLASDAWEKGKTIWDIIIASKSTPQSTEEQIWRKVISSTNAQKSYSERWKDHEGKLNEMNRALEKLLDQWDNLEKGDDVNSESNNLKTRIINARIHQDELIENHKKASRDIKEAPSPLQLPELEKKGLLNKQKVDKIVEERQKLINETKQEIARIIQSPWYENYENIKENNMFHTYAKDGNMEVLKESLRKATSSGKTALNRANENGHTPLDLAIVFAAGSAPEVQQKSLEMVKLMVESGANVNADPNHVGEGEKAKREPALTVAIKVGSERVFDYLLKEKKANINLQDNEGNTALHILAQRTDPVSLNMVIKLLKRGARLDIKNAEGKTALQIAEQNEKFMNLYQQSQKPFAFSKGGFGTFFSQKKAPQEHGLPARETQQGQEQKPLSPNGIKQP